MTASEATLGEGTSQVRRTPADLRRIAREEWAADHAQAAVAAAWAAYDKQPDDRDGKRLLADLLRRYPDQVGAEREGALLRLLGDPQIDPNHLNTAGWRLARRGATEWQDDGNDAGFDALAAHVDHDDLSRTLLRESPVLDRTVERTLTRLRRWLLISGRWPHYPRLVDALREQAILNGGAWPFDDAERELLDASAGSPIVTVYLPVRPTGRKSDGGNTDDAVTRAVRMQYERWPYPPWRRITVGNSMRFPDWIRRHDPDGPAGIPIDANVLIAGCGTGREAAKVALRFPQTRVTAIDISETSLDYARRQCAQVGATNIRFVRLDLHDCGQLGERFDAIYCAGVLHHLPDPEKGWAALEAVVRPGGVMIIMVYSRISRFRVIAARHLLRDLATEPMTDDLLRRVRGKIMEHADHPAARVLMNSGDFSTLAGAHDLLVHSHEDPFDIPRISRALDRLGLGLIGILFPTVDAEARYDARFPHDPRHRDPAAWAQFEKSEVARRATRYTFLCRKPLHAP